MHYTHRLTYTVVFGGYYRRHTLNACVAGILLNRSPLNAANRSLAVLCMKCTLIEVDLWLADSVLTDG